MTGTLQKNLEDLQRGEVGEEDSYESDLSDVMDYSDDDAQDMEQ